MSAGKVLDRRVHRTQTSLRNALVDLILERGWDAVSVQAVCGRAGVGRSTFYAHYADKEELLLRGFDAFRSELRAHVRRAGGDRLSFITPLLAHVEDHRKLFRALAGKRCAQHVRRRLLDVISDMLDGEPGKRSALRRATVRYAAGACVELLVYWLEERSSLGARELERLLYELTSALVREGLQP